jgi:hypothetical protein
MITLLSEVNIDTIGDAWKSDGACKSLLIDAVGFGGGTVTIEVKRDGGQWVVPTKTDGTPTAFLQNSLEKFDYAGAGYYVRARLNGSTGASKVNVCLS